MKYILLFTLLFIIGGAISAQNDVTLYTVMTDDSVRVFNDHDFFYQKANNNPNIVFPGDFTVIMKCDDDPMTLDFVQPNNIRTSYEFKPLEVPEAKVIILNDGSSHFIEIPSNQFVD